MILPTTNEVLGKWANEAECRAYYEANHPHVKRVLEEGACTMVNSPFGVLVFGDQSQPIIIVPNFRRYATPSPFGIEDKRLWPTVLWFGSIQLERLGDIPAASSALYKIVPE